MQNEKQSNEVNILWTGGWDSTFRLLQLLLEEQKRVQPYYMIDPERISTGAEIHRMGTLKRDIHNLWPDTKNLFLPTYYVNIESIQPDEEIRKAYHHLKNFVPLGSQYVWIPEFCKQHSLYEMEMSIENGANQQIIWKNLDYLKNQFSDNPDKLSDKEREIYQSSKTLFQYFRFPIIHLKKNETYEIAKEKGWMKLMNRTWFCYHPLIVPFRGLVPCGNCITCKFQEKSGFKWRIPFYVKSFQKIRHLKNKLVGIKK